jgi:hypothetical protein
MCSGCGGGLSGWEKLPFWLYLPLFPLKVALNSMFAGKGRMFLPALILVALGLLAFPFLLAFGVHRELRERGARRRALRSSDPEQPASATGEAASTELNRVP